MLGIEKVSMFTDVKVVAHESFVKGHVVGEPNDVGGSEMGKFDIGGVCVGQFMIAIFCHHADIPTHHQQCEFQYVISLSSKSGGIKIFRKRLDFLVCGLEARF